MYSRDTELRHVQANDVYKLGLRLDVNNCWKKLMEIIPKELNASTSSAKGSLDWEKAARSGFKYNNDHIRLIENAINRPGESRSFSQILFDEWSTSGRKDERPTVGVLLQLLEKAELFGAADFVAEHFLNEALPERPANGPAARINISLSSEIYNDIEDLVNDTSFYPGTQSLNDNANYAISLIDNNKDFYTKYQRIDKTVPGSVSNAPVPPPRVQRSTRLLLQEQSHNTSEPTTAEAINNTIPHIEEQMHKEDNLPKFSQLMTNSTTVTSAAVNIERNNLHSPHTESTQISEAPIPMISVLGGTPTMPTIGANRHESAVIDTNEMLPVISALNLNGERDDPLAKDNSPLPVIVSSNLSSKNKSMSDLCSESCNLSFGNNSELPDILENIDENEDNPEPLDDEDNDDVDEDEDSSVPNLSIFDQRSSNNDSSLTNVTGTSGENSFELSMNDCSSASNENIPCLSALKP